jgi:hypothetical protein
MNILMRFTEGYDLYKFRLADWKDAPPKCREEYN